MTETAAERIAALRALPRDRFWQLACERAAAAGRRELAALDTPAHRRLIALVQRSTQDDPR